MAISENQTKPAFANPVDSDIDAIRERFAWVVACLAVNGAALLPDWTGTAVSTESPLNQAEPNYHLFTCDSDAREVRVDLTWTANKITTAVLKYNPGTTSPGMATVTGGTFAITYDGDGNYTGYTTS